MAGVLEHPPEFLDASKIGASSSVASNALSEASTFPETHKLILASAQLSTLVGTLEQLHSRTSQASLVKEAHIGDDAGDDAAVAATSTKGAGDSYRGDWENKLSSLKHDLLQLLKEEQNLKSSEKLLLKAKAELAKVKAEVVTAKEELAKLKAETGVDPRQITFLESEMYSAQNDITSIKHNIASIQSNLASIKKTKSGLSKVISLLVAGMKGKLAALKDELKSSPNGTALFNDVKQALTDAQNQVSGVGADSDSFGSLNKALIGLSPPAPSGGVGDSPKTPQGWKKWLEKLMEFFQGNWTGEDFTNFLLMMLQGVKGEGNMPPNIKAEFKKLLKSVMQELKKEDPKDFALMLEDITLALGGAMGGTAADFAEAEKLMKEMLQQSGVSASINWPNYEKQASEGWPAIQRGVTAVLTNVSRKYFTPDFRAAIQPDMNHMFGACIANESIGEKIADLLGTWDYGIFNSIMDVQNLIMQEIQKIRNDLNAMQQDIDNMANSPHDAKSASDFKKRFDDLKKQESSRWLGSGSGSSGAALGSFLQFLANWGGGILSSGKSPSEIAAAVAKIMNSSGSSPSSDQQQITTNFSNITGTFSTASETQSMALQNSETQLDANLKINNACRQTITTLIPVISNYSNG